MSLSAQGKKVLSAIEQTVKHPTKHPVKLAALGVGGFLLVDYLVSAKGHSMAGKALDSVLPSAHARPRLAPPLPAAAAQQAAAKGYYAGSPFGPGWGRGNMPYQYGAHWQETPFEISAAHRAWAAASGGYPDVWTQSQYPWS